MAIGPDQITVRLQPRQFPRPRTRGKDDGGGSQVFNALVRGNRDAAFGGDRRHAHEDGDPVLLHQVADAARKLLGHTPRPGDDGGQVIADPVCLQPEFLGPVHQVEHLGRPQHRLGRNAAPVQADAAQVFPLDNRHLLAQLGRADGGHIATGTRADHDHVEGLGSHGLPPLRTSFALKLFSSLRQQSGAPQRLEPDAWLRPAAFAPGRHSRPLRGTPLPRHSTPGPGPHCGRETVRIAG